MEWNLIQNLRSIKCLNVRHDYTSCLTLHVKWKWCKAWLQIIFISSLNLKWKWFSLNRLIFETLSESWAKLTNVSRNASLALHNIIGIVRKRHVALKCLSFWRSGIQNSLSKRVKKSKVSKREWEIRECIYACWNIKDLWKYENQINFDVFMIMYELNAKYETGPRSAATFRSTSCSLL